MTTNGVTRHRAVAVGLFVVVLATCAGCGSTKTVEARTSEVPASVELVGWSVTSSHGGNATGSVTLTVRGEDRTAEATGKSGVGPPAEQVQFGYIRSLKRTGGQYRLRFDPAWFLTGVTANTAAAEDGAVSPGEPVPNDNYVVNESHRPFAYVVPANARVTVLKTGVAATPITVAQLAQLVAGKNPFPRPLFEGLDTGFWIRAHIDTVRSLDQQYHP